MDDAVIDVYVIDGAAKSFINAREELRSQAGLDGP